ncbi:MAG: N-acetyltransferase [Gammaproteobacteria bacterium]|nr:N-acetyltransferase [Gammaproteobacteria bacterium]
MFRAEQSAPGGAPAHAEFYAATVRRAAPADLAALVALERHFPGDRLSRQSFRRLLQSASAEVWVYEEAGQVTGNAVLLCRSNSTQARLYSLVVHPQHHGRGIARALLDAVEHTAAGRGCHRLSLEVRADNAPALRLYQKAGFQLIRQITDYYEDHASALRLEKPVASSK